jgi:hypothetical protein
LASHKIPAKLCRDVNLNLWVVKGVIAAMFSKFWSRTNFPASNCAAQIFTYVPMTLFFSLNYLTAGDFRDSSLEYFEGKIPAYLTFICLIANLSMHLHFNYYNHPDAAELNKKKQEQKEAALTIVHRIRLNKESTRAYLETESELNPATIKTLLDENLEEMSTKQILRMFSPLEKVYMLKHPQNLSQPRKVQKFISSAFNGLLHGLAHLNIPIILKVFANKDVIRDNDFSPEEIISRLIILLGIYSIFQTTLYNLEPKTPTTNDLLTCLNGSFFQQKSNKIRSTGINESRPLLLGIIVNEMQEKEDSQEVQHMIIKRAKADTNMPCCMAGHGI